MKIAIIKGDGIGPEVVESAQRVLEALNLGFDFVEAQAGYDCYKECGNPIPEETIELCKSTNATLFGSVTTPPNIPDYRSAIITLRKALDLYCNLRPMKSYAIPKAIPGIDFYIVRENTEGMYSGIERVERDGNNNIIKAITERVITRAGSERIVKFAFELAEKQGRKKVTVVHKANVLRETCGLFLRTAQDIAANYPDIEMEDVIVDAMAMHLIKRPADFDVIVTTNLFGDVLSDEASMLVGGLGFAASGNISDNNGIFEPSHGSAPKYRGKNVINPIATILSAKMMLTFLGKETEAERIENAIVETLKDKKNWTKDIGGTATTTQITDAIVNNL